MAKSFSVERRKEHRLGRNSPSMRMLLRLCLALDVRAADVLDDVERRMALLKARD